LAFAGVLAGVFLDALAACLRRVSSLSRGWSVVAVVVLLALLVALIAWLIGARVTSQLSELSTQLPQSWDEVQQRLDETQWGKWLVNRLPSSPREIERSDLFSQMTSALSTATAFLVGLAVVLFVGLYLAADPELYVDGIVQLVPLRERDRIRIALHQTGIALRWWLLGQLATMLLVGVTMGVGLWLIGIPLALSLGLLAFILEIIPNIGPVLAAIPALLIAWTESTSHLLLAGLLYVVVHGLESYVAIPLIQQRAVRLPPALSILMITLFGLLGGVIGMFVAAPLTITIIVLVKMLYVRDFLGDPHVKLPSTS